MYLLYFAHVFVEHLKKIYLIGHLKLILIKKSILIGGAHNFKDLIRHNQSKNDKGERAGFSILVPPLTTGHGDAINVSPAGLSQGCVKCL